MLTVGGEGGSKKVKLLTVVDGRMGGRFERENIKVLLLTIGGEGGLKKTKLLKVVDGTRFSAVAETLFNRHD